jgi:hypothetical protein
MIAPDPAPRRRRITASDAYPLQRVVYLLNRGRISWDRFVDALNVLCEGGDLDAMDFGDAESTETRVWRKFRCKTARTGEVAKAFGYKHTSEMGPRLARLSERGLVTRVSHGVWRFKP